VENGKQLESSDPHCIVLPGGWHGIQFDLMRDLGINAQIAQLLEKNRHFLLLCAGAILGRTEGGINDPNEGVKPGTALGLIDYRIVNNVLNTPRDVHMRIHPPTDPIKTQSAKPESRLFTEVPFSNGPYMRGCNPDKTDVIARIASDSRAFDINDDDGQVVGVQKRQEHELSPVVMGVGYHHTFVPYVFLRDVGLYRQRLLHARKERQLKQLYREQELRWQDE
jgi:glutamine amidotransferase PdxT